MKRIAIAGLIAISSVAIAKGGGGGGGHSSAHSSAHVSESAHAVESAHETTPARSSSFFPSWMWWHSSGHADCDDKKKDCKK